MSYHSKMFCKLSAIAVFTLLLATLPVRADDFREHFVAAEPATTLPDFTFEDAQGRSLRLGDFHGHAVLLNLWASWCGPCVQEMPSLDKLQSIIGLNNLSIIALDEERNGGIDTTRSFFKRHEVGNLALYSDPSGRIASILHARGLPTSVLIDADGHVIGRVEGGADWSAPDAVAFIRAHITKSQSF